MLICGLFGKEIDKKNILKNFRLSLNFSLFRLEYMTNMRSLYQLFKTELKFSDKESLKAQEEKRILDAKEKRLFEENKLVNEKILAEQLRDEEVRLSEMKKRAEDELRRKMEDEARLAELADERVRRLKARARTFIDPNNLEAEIEKALDERKSYNFAITAKGLPKMPREATEEKPAATLSN